jgi:hypothetical protein
MSRLLEKIKKQSENPTVQMGFRKAVSTVKPPAILLIAEVTAGDGGTALNKVEGADAVLLDSSSQELTAKHLKKMTEPLGDIPWGVILEQHTDEINKIEEAGCDFVLLSPATPVAAAPKNEKTGKIIQVESSMDDGLIMALNTLPVDAVLADDIYGEGGVMSYHHLMMTGYLGMMVRKPLIVTAPLSITKDELKALWDAGVEAVMIVIDAAKGEDLKELHAMAASLPPRSADKQKKGGILLPHAAGKLAEPIPDEEDEDDE